MPTINLNNITDQLISIPKFGNGTGLHRMRYLCSEILDSQWMKKVKIINVVGTNGKGSVTAIISNILHELKLNYGQYTSPHLFEFSERIIVNKNKIPNNDLNRITNYFFEKENQYIAKYPGDHFGAFEAFTYIGLQYFFEKKVDVLVLEAGIGGRYDSTRVAAGDFVAFTSLDLEHANILGPTKELIAYDKIDIAPESAQVVIGKTEAGILRKLKQYAKYKKIKLLPVVEYVEVENIVFENGKMNLNIEVEELFFKNIESSLTGYHQVTNISVAILLLKKWAEKYMPEIMDEKFRQAVTKALPGVSWPGRLEKIKNDPPVYIDAGHTPDAIRQLVESFAQIKETPCLLVTGVSHDKNIENIIKELLSIADTVVCTRAYHKGAPASEVYEVVRQHNFSSTHLFQYEKLEQALDFSIQHAKVNQMTLLIAGGLFLAAEAHHYLNGNNPSALQFF